MDKKQELVSFNHSVSITERKNLLISGVKKIESFDDKEFFLESVMGFILIKGEGLELIKLDTFQGTVSIKGKVNSFIYLEESKKQPQESVFAKLFK